MAGVRLLIQFTADSREIADRAIEALTERCKQCRQEPDCLQFEVFRSALDPQHYVLLEHWASQEALDVHAELNRRNPPPPRPGITSVREDYAHQTKT
jgi:quinol monooxygenase YgiN